jgi:hypothetical protein
MERKLLGFGSLKALSDLSHRVSVMEANRRKISLLTSTFLKNILSACFEIIWINCLNKIFME